MKQETAAERAAWTAHVEGKDGTSVVRANKYHAVKHGRYASKHEAKVAGELAVRALIGDISDLKEQVTFVLVEGRGKVRPIIYIADFTYREGGELVVADAKGYKNAVYRLKKKLLFLLHGIEIKEL